jgi:NADH-quinone oxidoreductase subunit L
MDEIYEAVIVRPLRRLADGLYLFDRHVIDGLVNSCGQLPRALGGLLRTLQMGLVQFYGLAMVLVVVVVLAARLIWASG